MGMFRISEATLNRSLQWMSGTCLDDDDNPHVERPVDVMVAQQRAPDSDMHHEHPTARPSARDPQLAVAIPEDEPQDVASISPSSSIATSPSSGVSASTSPAVGLRSKWTGSGQLLSPGARSVSRKHLARIGARAAPLLLCCILL